MKEPGVTIVSSMYGATDEFLLKQQKLIDGQKYTGKVTHILINDNVKNPRKQLKGMTIINNKENLGVCASLNKGFKMSKTDIIVALADDCTPSSNTWLRQVVAPFVDPTVAGATANVELPVEFWNKFSYFAKALTEKEQRVIVPGLDAKGCAYRKKALEHFGYLNEKEFRQGGEDTDLTLKIEQSDKWKLAKTKAKVFHYHHFSAPGRLKKEIQYARLSGLVSRKHFFNFPWNFKAHVVARLGLALWFIISLFTSLSVWLPSILILVLANMRLPKQIMRLGRDPRIITVPFLNLYLYLIYVFNYTYAIVLKPTV